MPPPIVAVINILSFARYFVALRLRTALGLHATANPLTISWRWKHWKHIRERRSRS